VGFQEPSWETTFRHGAAATTIQPGTEPPFAGLATEVHVDLYCEQIRPDGFRGGLKRRINAMRRTTEGSLQ